MSLRRSAALAAALFCAVLSPSFAAEPSLANGPIRFGDAWYPEQWPESRWEADLTLMQQAHMNVVRVGEFAWSTMEPSEGHFDFGWLDRAIALAQKHGIAVVLGTPTAAPPAWLTSKYPETLRVDENGERAEHGGRRQFSATDPKYLALSAEIARQMAEHFGHNPDVIGWQIDNEVGAASFDDTSKKQWHQWLQKKYGTIASLNDHWTTAYWSQTYDNFDQVPLHSRGENPALLLDYDHFMTDVWVSYIQNQVDAIRPHIDSRQFITTNTMHWYSAFDHYAIHRNLDIAAWDDYFASGRLDPMLNGALHDLVRGYKEKNFWVMETQPSFTNYGNPSSSPLPPGVVREMAWQAVGHGADAVLYWQWRSALNGQEQYHGTILGADGLPVPIYAEIARVGSEFAKTSPAIEGTSVHNRVAILQSYDAHWAIDFQRHTSLFDYPSAVMDVYRAVDPAAQGVDVISPEADLSHYPVVFAPALNVISDALGKHLLDYVRNGGHLVLTERSGMKDQYNALNPQDQPGPLASALGAHVEQYYALSPQDPKPAVSGPAGTGTASVWAELLHIDSPDTKTLLTYGPDQTGSNGWLANQPAAVQHTYGKGSITYIGAMLDSALMDRIARQALTSAGIQPILPGLPDGIELMQRSAAGKPPVWILINHNTEAATVTLPSALPNLLTPDAAPSASLALPPHGIAVLAPGAAK